MRWDLSKSREYVLLYFCLETISVRRCLQNGTRSATSSFETNDHLWLLVDGRETVKAEVAGTMMTTLNDVVRPLSACVPLIQMLQETVGARFKDRVFHRCILVESAYHPDRCCLVAQM